MYRPTLHCSLVVVKSLTQAAQTTDGVVFFIPIPLAGSPSFPSRVSWHTSNRPRARFPDHRCTSNRGLVLCKRSIYRRWLQPTSWCSFRSITVTLRPEWDASHRSLRLREAQNCRPALPTAPGTLVACTSMVRPVPGPWRRSVKLQRATNVFIAFPPSRCTGACPVHTECRN